MAARSGGPIGHAIEPADRSVVNTVACSANASIYICAALGLSMAKSDEFVTVECDPEEEAWKVFSSIHTLIDRVFDLHAV